MSNFNAESTDGQLFFHSIGEAAGYDCFFDCEEPFLIVDTIAQGAFSAPGARPVDFLHVARRSDPEAVFTADFILGVGFRPGFMIPRLPRPEPLAVTYAGSYFSIVTRSPGRPNYTVEVR